MTSLEHILTKYHLTRNKFMLLMGITAKDNKNTAWYEKIAGKRVVTAEEAKLVIATVYKLGIHDKVEMAADKYLIV